ncbi:serine/threonine-protein kinase haspin-like [Ornithodoros turicata]|uniref:serine/threonine-protein kinase haspin-like n=1 Tax=Ornithodoros turicata TaxID=34597 RepID=UPI00313962B6
MFLATIVSTLVVLATIFYAYYNFQKSKEGQKVRPETPRTPKQPKTSTAAFPVCVVASSVPSDLKVSGHSMLMGDVVVDGKKDERQEGKEEDVLSYGEGVQTNVILQKPVKADTPEERSAGQNWLTRNLTQLQAHSRGYLLRQSLERTRQARQKAALAIQTWWKARRQGPGDFEDEDDFFGKCGNADFYRVYQSEESEVTWSAEETDMLLEQTDESETETGSGYETGTSSAATGSRLSRCEQSEGMFGDLLTLVGQSKVLTFHDVLATVRHAQGCVKIAEGTHSDIFRIYTAEGTSILKVTNLEYIVTFWDTLYAEAAISLELSNLRNRSDFHTIGFADTKGVFCLFDSYPREFIQAWKDYTSWKRTDHVHGPERLEDPQPYIVFHTTYAGVPLTQVKVDTALQLRSILQQVAVSLAVAECAYQFEHRDLSLNHILVDKTQYELIQCSLNGQSIFINTWGVVATVIDYALSRLKDSNTGQIIFSNLRRLSPYSSSTGLSNIYKYVGDLTKGNWAGFYPKTNVAYMIHVTNQLYQAYQQKFGRQSDRMEADAWSDVHSWRVVLPEYRSMADFVHSKFRFAGS